MAENTLPSIDQYQSYHVQGSLLKSRIMYIHFTHGAMAIKQVVERLPAEAKEVLTKSIFIGEWYPITILLHLDRAIMDVFSPGNDKIYEDLGAFSAGINLSGAYEPLVRKDIHEFLQHTAMLHRAYQDFGEAQYIMISEDAALLQVLYPQPPPENYCKSGIGYFRRALELCGGNNVSVRMTGCQRNQDAFCEYRLEWNGWRYSY